MSPAGVVFSVWLLARRRLRGVAPSCSASTVGANHEAVVCSAASCSAAGHVGPAV